MTRPKAQTDAEWRREQMRDAKIQSRRGRGRQMAVGAIVIWPLDTVPPRSLVCNGAIYNIADYPELGELLGSSYGGDGTTTFGVPDYRGFTVVGQKAGDLDFDAMGETGGAKTVTLTTAQIPPHGHQQRMSTGQIAAGGGNAVGGMTISGGTVPGTPVQQTTVDTGGGGSHQNLQPYVVARFIIQA